MTIIENIKLAQMKVLGREDDEGMTLMVVTHEMGFAHRVVFMDEGRIEEDCTKEDFFGSPHGDRANDFLSKILTH